MKFKKIMFVGILLLAIFAIGAVSAIDVNDTAIANEDTSQIELSTSNEITEDNLQTSEENEALASTDYDEAIAQTGTEVLGVDSAKYSDLAAEISRPGNINLTHKNYTYDKGETITISEDNKVIDGNGAVIDMNGPTIRAFYISASGVTIKNLTIINANYDRDGGAIYFSSSATSGTVSNCNFTNNTASYGGAVCFSNNGEVANCNFINNTANSYGGAVFFSSNGTVTNCNFTANTATDGGAIYFDIVFDSDSKGNVTNCNFINNIASYGGAVHFFSNGTVTNCNFTNNSASVSGGAVYFYKSSTVTNCNFTNNSASGYGGAICFDIVFDSDSKGNVTNCNFINNSASVSSGAIRMNSGTVSNCNFTNNTASYGGAVFFVDQGNVTNCNFTGNTATGTSSWGGAVCFWGEGSVSNCNFTNNKAIEYNGRGGAVYFPNNANGNVINCNFTDNEAYDGGAVYFLNTGTVSNCNFTNNHATRNGGAIFFKSTGNGNVSNCNFINCSAELGKVIYANNNTLISYCTFETQGSETLRELVIGGNTSNCTVKKYKDKTATNITITVNDITYGETLNIIVNVQKDATGNMALTINTKDYTANIENGQVAFNITGLNAGNYEVKVDYAGDSNYMAAQNITQICVNKVSTAITSSAVTTVYNVNKNLIITLKDAEGNLLGGVDIIVNLNGAQTYTTGDNGQVKVSTKGLTPKTYTAIITFKGNINYDKSARNVKVTVKKATPKITAKAKTFKKSVKTKKYTVTLKTNQNKVMKNIKLTLKVNKKTYTAKTNAKGQATFKITKLTKKGKHTAVVKFAGNKYYNAKTAKAKIIVK